MFVRPNGERLQELDTAFKWLFRQCGIEDFRIHDLRHTCASWFVSKGGNCKQKESLGHSTIKMTERYSHLAPENVRAAVSVLDGRRNLGHAVFDMLELVNLRH